MVVVYFSTESKENIHNLMSFMVDEGLVRISEMWVQSFEFAPKKC